MSTADKVIAVAKAQVGYHEGYSGGHWDNIEKYAAQVPGLSWANGQPWCATFVSYCFNAVGVLSLIPGGATASVAHLRDAAKAAGRFNQYPAVGAIVIFGANGDAHTGIVAAFDATTITTVEGNTNTNGSAEGDGVYLKTHNRTDAWVYGYSYPKFPEGIDSADPSYPKPARTTAPAPTPTETRDMALLTDLETVRKNHGVSRVYAARLLIRAAAAVSGPIRKAALNAVLALLRGIA